MTATELRQYVTTTETDQALKARLSALELLIRSYTNNNFQKRAFRGVAVANSENKTLLFASTTPFKVGDTLQITESEYQDDVLVTVSAVSGTTVTVSEDLFDESGVVVTKVVYPEDIKLGVANMVKWQLNNGDKVGVQSETISRHSVTYFSMDGENAVMGFPKSLTGFLRPYIKARFGQGLKLK